MADESDAAGEDFEARKERLSKAPRTLTLVQVVRTLPAAFPGELNTCGPGLVPQ
jgi:hypothetical protein